MLERHTSGKERDASATEGPCRGKRQAARSGGRVAETGECSPGAIGRSCNLTRPPCARGPRALSPEVIPRVSTLARALAGFVVAGALTAQAAAAQVETPSDTTSPSPDTTVVSDTTTVYELPGLVVVGRDESVATSAFLSEALRVQPSGVNALEALNRAPAFNFTAADPFGFYEFGQNVQLRVFNREQVAMTVDGIPLGSQATGGGSPVGRFIESESVSQVKVHQGSGNIETVSNFGLGGAVTFETDRPRTEPSVRLEFSGGEFSSRRGYGRFDTGLFGSGSRAYASVSRNEFDKWRGQGDMERTHVEGKFFQELENGSLSINIYYNDREDHDFLDVSLETFEEVGYDVTLRNEFAVLSDKEEQARLNAFFFDAWTNRREDFLLGTTLDLEARSDLHLRLTPYFHNQNGVGTWLPNFRPDASTADPLGNRDFTRSTWRETQYGLNRFGTTGTVTWEASSTLDVSAGGWIERSERIQRRVWFDLPDMDVFDKSSFVPFWTQFDRNFDTNTYTAYGKAVFRPLPELRLDAGLRGHIVEMRLDDDVNNEFGEQEDRVGFLPQFGAVYDIASSHQLFGSVSRNFSQVPDDALRQTAEVEPETSVNLDLGYRFFHPRASSSVTFFFVDYSDKIETITFGEFDRFANETVLQNVGEIRSFGVELTGDFSLGYGFDLFASASWNDSEYRKDIADASEPDGVLRLKGNDVVFTPSFQSFNEVSWSGRGFRVGLTGRFVGRRPSSLSGPVDGDPSNQEELNSYFLLGATASYQWNRWTIGLQATNLTDETYLASTSGLGPGTARHPGVATFFPGTSRWIVARAGVAF